VTTGVSDAARDACVLLVTLAGCGGGRRTPPTEPLNPCQMALLLMQNPSVDPLVKQVALEKARNMGCLQ